MAVVTRPVPWGSALLAQTFGTDGGLRRIVDVIRHEVGSQIGVRNTFSKLYRVTDPAELDSRDLFRAWLLLAALGEDPAEWGVPADIIPGAFDAEALRKRLPELLCPQQDSNLRHTVYNSVTSLPVAA